MFYFIAFITTSLFFMLIIINSIEDKFNASSFKHSFYYNALNRQVIIDDFFVVVSFRKGSLNCCLFEHLNNHQGIRLTYDDLDTSVFKGRNVELNKVVDAMGFKGDLKRILFTFDSNSITFHPEKLNQSIDLIKIG
ncbi:hypothetical protein [Candidatus Williamhamiltonella defendens]|uniref:Uncharacterized protein n=2 Tax=Candidatus Williamhamiltonella defendens TaxID=138072 RepID=A0A249E0A3_9ENTR|nr:hypothetical protein [Candidatus Hamiltonella defensa]ASX26945.1 hypothetical protein BA171_08125 [Candidatus Hamiltonella defensa (Bemisia tabaci)]CED79354.1 Conserved hypothetical protein [Candidatus Hamiltonella defensa (Bemisia tabaci)]